MTGQGSMNRPVLKKEHQTKQPSKASITTPVILLTGFLGSGKTTLLNRLLADDRMAGTAVVVNEFGSISVDHDLVYAGREGYVTTSSGCLCCTASSDVRTSLYELHEARRKGEIPPFRSRHNRDDWSGGSGTHHQQSHTRRSTGIRNERPCRCARLQSDERHHDL